MLGDPLNGSWWIHVGDGDPLSSFQVIFVVDLGGFPLADPMVGSWWIMVDPLGEFWWIQVIVDP